MEAGMNIFAEFHKADETCKGNQHVWFVDNIPPRDDEKCECGGKTWRQYFGENEEILRIEQAFKEAA
jgi:hypothetical protein